MAKHDTRCERSDPDDFCRCAKRRSGHWEERALAAEAERNDVQAAYIELIRKLATEVRRGDDAERALKDLQDRVVAEADKWSSYSPNAVVEHRIAAGIRALLDTPETVEPETPTETVITQHRADVHAALFPDTCACPPCPGRGNDGHGMTHCAECCFETGVEADLDCPKHGDRM